MAGGSFGTINVASGAYTLNNINATNQFVSQIEASPNADQGGSIFYEANFGPLRDVKIGVDARRIAHHRLQQPLCQRDVEPHDLRRQRRAPLAGPVRARAPTASPACRST